MFFDAIFVSGDDRQSVSSYVYKLFAKRKIPSSIL